MNWLENDEDRVKMSSLKKSSVDKVSQEEWRRQGTSRRVMLKRCLKKSDADMQSQVCLKSTERSVKEANSGG